MTIVATPIPNPGSGATPHSAGDMWVAFATLTFSGSYVTNGDSWDATLLFPGPGVTQVLCVDITGGAGYTFEYDKTNKKLKLFSSANTETTAAAYNAALTGDANIVAQVYAV